MNMWVLQYTSRKGINAGSCFGMELHRLKSRAPTSAFYDHSKKIHLPGYGNTLLDRLIQKSYRYNTHP